MLLCKKNVTIRRTIMTTVNELADILSRASSDGFGDYEVLMPCGTGGDTSPYGLYHDEENETSTLS